MAQKTKKIRHSGRFGTGYGTKVRTRLNKVESQQRIKQTCIFCKGIAKRLSKGLWKCKKCGKKFASHTYYLKQT